MKTKIEIEIKISCIENEITQLYKSDPTMVTEVWLENMNSAIRALKWVLDIELNSIKYKSKNHNYYGRFGAPA